MVTKHGLTHIPVLTGALQGFIEIHFVEHVHTEIQSCSLSVVYTPLDGQQLEVFHGTVEPVSNCI